MNTIDKKFIPDVVRMLSDMKESLGRDFIAIKEGKDRVNKMKRAVNLALPYVSKGV